MKQQLIKIFEKQLIVFYMCTDMNNNNLMITQLTFQDFTSCSLFITIPKVGGTGLIHSVDNRGISTQMCYVLIEQYQAIAYVVRLREIRVPFTWLLITEPSGNITRVTDLLHLLGVAHISLLYSLIN